MWIYVSLPEGIWTCLVEFTGNIICATVNTLSILGLGHVGTSICRGTVALRVKRLAHTVYPKVDIESLQEHRTTTTQLLGHWSCWFSSSNDCNRKWHLSHTMAHLWPVAPLVGGWFQLFRDHQGSKECPLGDDKLRSILLKWGACELEDIFHDNRPSRRHILYMCIYITILTFFWG